MAAVTSSGNTLHADWVLALREGRTAACNWQIFTRYSRVEVPIGVHYIKAYRLEFAWAQHRNYGIRGHIHRKITSCPDNKQVK